MSTKRLFLILGIAALALMGVALAMALQRPPLIRAADEGDTEQVDRLLKSGVDPDTQARGLLNDRYDEWTPLMRAVSEGHTDTVRALLDAGADHSHRSRFDETPLALVFNVEDQRAALEITDALLDAGADPAAMVIGEETPLHIAARVDRTRLLDRLLQEGVDCVDVDAVDALGQTALREALEQGASMETVRLLLDRGADPTFSPGQDASPIEMARDPEQWNISAEIAAEVRNAVESGDRPSP